MKAVQINANATIRRDAITADQHCVIVDNFLDRPRELVDFAASHAGEFSRQASSYPGSMLRIDADAMADIYQFIRNRMTKHFPFFRGNLDYWTYLSIVTLPPDELSYLQRICHTDPERSPGRASYAGLVYLFDNEALGGTSFFRWKEPRLVKEAEAIGLEDPGQALAYLQERCPTFRKPPCYMTGSNEIAELLCTIPPRFNRLVFYSGDVPHSGAITAPELLSGDVRKGRLTLNIYASVLPKQGRNPPQQFGE